MGYGNKLFMSSVGGLVVSVLASVSQDRGFKPGRSRRIFRRKNPQHAFLRGGSKAVCQCHLFVSRHLVATEVAAVALWPLPCPGALDVIGFRNKMHKRVTCSGRAVGHLQPFTAALDTHIFLPLLRLRWSSG
jgi:hypothetical protein